MVVLDLVHRVQWFLHSTYAQSFHGLRLFDQVASPQLMSSHFNNICGTITVGPLNLMDLLSTVEFLWGKSDTITLFLPKTALLFLVIDRLVSKSSQAFNHLMGTRTTCLLFPIVRFWSYPNCECTCLFMRSSLVWLYELYEIIHLNYLNTMPNFCASPHSLGYIFCAADLAEHIRYVSQVPSRP